LISNPTREPVTSEDITPVIFDGGCIGNGDKMFLPLVQMCNGIFKNATDMYVDVVYMQGQHNQSNQSSFGHTNILLLAIQ